MSNHTPAPWHTNGKSIFSGDYLIITTVNNDVFTQETNEANAVLIAAAPELLEALRELVAYHGSDVDNGLDELLTAARTAITKATGQEI